MAWPSLEAIARGLPVVTTREVAVAGAATDAAWSIRSATSALRERLSESSATPPAALGFPIAPGGGASATALERWARTMLRAIEAARRAS